MMRVEEFSPRVVVWFLAVILLFVAFYLALLRVDRFLHDNAIDQCAHASRFERRDGNGTVVYPIDAFYQDCLKKKSL